ncbi:MAG TPA: hypothetical protein VN773_14400 [Verrucomicrobiae bacterium]|jgi:hypothetical protein|nr:hypothetical protein [Verrucomicrobiae bacterium]
MRTDEDLSPADILAEWRAAERELVNCRQGSNDYDTLAARVHELATAYREASRPSPRETQEPQPSAATS